MFKGHVLQDFTFADNDNLKNELNMIGIDQYTLYVQIHH